MKIKKITFALLAVCAAVFNLNASESPKAGKPFVVPELKEWKPGSGEFVLGESFRVAVPSGDSALLFIAEAFAQDWEIITGYRPAVINAKGGSGDIVFKLKADKVLGEEGYELLVDKSINLSSPTPKGLFWGTQTILQIAGNVDAPVFPKGRIRDWPDYAIRGFMLDCARKYIPMDYLRKLVRIMAYYKMNTFQIHLNDNGFKQYFGNDWSKTYSAFRLECETYPGLTAKDGYYTKAEFIDFQKEAAERYITVIPEIDVPAHSLAFTQYRPEIGSEKYGMDHLDIFKPETYEFVDALFDEYLRGDEPVFVGPMVHIGTDEYSNQDQKVVEKFRSFTDHYIRLVESYGKQAVVWGALTHADGKTPVKSENVIMSIWNSNYANPDKMFEAGYKIINLPDWDVYIVPVAGYYRDYLDEENLYENWTPAHVAKYVYEEKHPSILGGFFALWNDHVGNGISVKDVHHRLFSPLQTLSVKMWTGAAPVLTYEEFDQARKSMIEAPGVNEAGRIGPENSKVLEMDKVEPGMEMLYPEIGYGYTVKFRIEGREEAPGTELFRSDNAVFYLCDPISGMFGFARDGYLNTFRYRIGEGENAEIEIRGDETSTTLIVNGKVIDRLEIEKRWYNEGKSIMHYVPTLVFPLEHAGDFRSTVTDLEVYNYIEKN